MIRSKAISGSWPNKHDIQGVQECSRYPKMQNFKNLYYNKDNRIWCFDLFK